MIRPLRRMHLLMIALLAVVLVVLFIASLTARKPVPANPQLPNALFQDQTGGQR